LCTSDVARYKRIVARLAIGLHRLLVPFAMTEFRVAAAETVAAPPPVVADPPAVLVGQSAAMERLRRDVLRTAARNQPALIVGEPGTGKSLVARALHEQGPRADQSCAVVACEVFPDTLLEAEVFGCASGIMLGAARERRGVLELSGGGTVILENIDVTSARTQALVARFVATGIIQPLGAGGGAGVAVDTRTVATCTIDGAARARIQSELASRLGARVIHVPSLRERRSDIPALAQFFAAGSALEQRRVGFSAAALSALMAYSWPGNVRQLRIVVERLVMAGRSGDIQANELPVGIRPRPEGAAGSRARVPSVGEELFARVQASGESFWSAVYPLFMKREITRADLRDLIRRALEATRGNADELVRILNMPRSDGRRFLRFLRKYDCGLTG
jgi:DNA-binding NtrC family response regulator